ncbi:MAG: B12-binding domain-containing radical SAM protein, partial [Candidatus Hydrogenedens sp.]
MNWFFHKTTQKKNVKILYILPSHYDDDGYPYHFWKGLLPSNTLVCMRALTQQLINEKKLDEQYEIHVEIRDEFVQKIDVDKIVKESKKQNEILIVGLVGVQTNMFARATDLAMIFRKYQVPVIIGGFHVSGVIKLFGTNTPDLKLLMDNGVSLVCGEVEGSGILATILNDAINNRLQPYYIISESPNIQNAPIPVADPEYLKHFMQPMCTIDTSRGCPFNCSFCTIINVQGRKIRCRSAEKILEVVEQNYDNGFFSYFFTDDNMSRSPIWKELFTGLIELKQKGKKIRFMMQIDTQSWKIPDFVQMASEAGCYLVFIGMESINPQNLVLMGKTQNKTSEYAEMVEAWHKAGILVHVGYIIGMPCDTPQTIIHDVRLLKSEVKVDEASFFIMTPIPGSRDHKERIERGEKISDDCNCFDSCHETFPHPNFKTGELKKSWLKAWSLFYSKDNIIDILLRCPPEQYWNAFWLTLWNRYSTLLSNHPMSMGFLRKKVRKERRPTMEKESITAFLHRRIKDFLNQVKVVMQVFYEYQEIWLLTRKQLKEKRESLASAYSYLQEIRACLAQILQSSHYTQFVSQEYEQILQKTIELILQ